jgi:HEPN domain-containing protein
MGADAEPLFAAASRILEGATRDLERGHRLSACVSAHRAAVLATEAWLRARGQPVVSASVHENVSLAPDAAPGDREAARLLDRHRMEEGSPHRSAHAPGDPETEAVAVVEAGRVILAFVEARLGAAEGPR